MQEKMKSKIMYTLAAHRDILEEDMKEEGISLGWRFNFIAYFQLSIFKKCA